MTIQLEKLKEFKVLWDFARKCFIEDGDLGSCFKGWIR